MNEAGASEKPLSIGMVIAEKVITEEGTGNKTIVSTFNTITAKRFPCFHPTVAVYVALTNGSGQRTVQLRLRWDKDEETLVQLGGPVMFDNPNHVVELVFNMKNLPLPEPGLYAFEILADDEYIGEVKFNAQQQTETQ